MNVLITFSKPEISSRDLKPGHNIWNMDWATVHRVAQSWTQLKRLSMHACIHTHTHTQMESLCCTPKTNTTL